MKILLVTAMLASAAAHGSNAWRAAAEQDVRAAYDIYLADHPGVHDPANPAFGTLLERARQAALARAAQAATYTDYVEALAAFSSVLEDGHALLVAKPEETAGALAGRQWPGFVAAWRDGLVVHHAGKGSPAQVRSEILGCDGLAPRELLKERLRSRGFRAGEEGHYWFLAPRVFAPTAGFVHTRPKTCRFRLPNGKEREARLRWSPAPEDLGRMLVLASDGERTPVGLSEPREGVFLIGLPDFQPDAEEQQSYRTLYEELSARSRALREARAVVLDLRHNNGGSSDWGLQVAARLWGQSAVDQRMADHFREVGIWWRASEANLAHLVFLEGELRKQDKVALADLVAQLIGGMRKAIAEGEPFFVQPKDSAAAEAAASAPSKFDAPVYVIVPGRCASACLDALDAFTRFDNVRLIGAPTSADTTYLEVRLQDLPSGKGQIAVPTKVWVRRRRGSGEIYRPHILMTRLDWSTAAFLDRIQQDLGRQ
jgi:Peptidase family S41